MQIKIVKCYSHSTPSRVAKTKRINNAQCWQEQAATQPLEG